jgi:beta-lactamase superfamily II metal-dependent hydrolase
VELRFYQAECGDAARIRYRGNDGKYHNVFIDSGYRRTFRHVLIDEIKAIQSAGEVIDLWIISHIHDDHIGGAIAYTEAVQDGEIEDVVQSWYYNPPRFPVSNYSAQSLQLVSSPKSITQGDDLLEYLLSIDKLPEDDLTNQVPIIDLYGLKISILSPDRSSLQSLRSKYAPQHNVAFERLEAEQISEAKAAQQPDYHKPLENFDLSEWQEDSSVENASSISALIEYENKKTLWLADAHPSIIVDSLTALGYTPDNPLICDWVKVSHHGSKGNNSDQLYNIIQCSDYLISADAENRHNLPNKECLVRMLFNEYRSSDSHYNFHFTYDNQLLRDIFEVDSEASISELNFSMILSGSRYIVSDSTQ